MEAPGAFPQMCRHPFLQRRMELEQNTQAIVELPELDYRAGHVLVVVQEQSEQRDGRQ